MNMIYKAILSKPKNYYAVAFELIKNKIKISTIILVCRVIFIALLINILSLIITGSLYAFESYYSYSMPSGSSYTPNLGPSYYAWTSENGTRGVLYEGLSTEQKVVIEDFLKNQLNVSFVETPEYGNTFNYSLQERYSFLGDKNNNFYYVFQLTGAVRDNTRQLYQVNKYIAIPFDEIVSLGLDTSFLEYGIQHNNHYGNQRNINISSVNYGLRALAKGNNSVALGTDAIVNEDAPNSVALGSQSIANVPNVISVGSDDLKRRIVNLDDGIDNSDAVTVRQLNRSIASAEIGDSSLSIFNEVSKDKVIFAGEKGTILSNIGMGAVTLTSMDAVTGAQLFSVKEDIVGFADDIEKNANSIKSLNTSVSSALSAVAASALLVDTLDETKADVSLNNLTDGGKEVLKIYAKNAVQEYLSGQNVVAPLHINQDNDSLSVGKGSVVNGTSSIAIGVGNQVNANNSGAFGDPSVINADESYVLGNDDIINTGATGSFIIGNDGVSDAKGGLLFGSNIKATVSAEDGMALGNRTEVIAKSAIALGSGSIADTENTLSIGNADLKRKIVNVADGDISQNSNEAVTGAQLFLTNEKVQQNTDAIAKKADIDAGNINTSDWATKLGIGKIEDGNTDLVTGGTVYDAMKGINDNKLVQSNDDTITIGKADAGRIIDVTNASGEGRVITGVVVNPQDKTSVANVGYVDSVGSAIMNQVHTGMSRLETKTEKVGANAAAMSALMPAPMDGDEKWSFSAAVGNYRSETAAAVGAFFKPQDNVIVNVRGTVGNEENMVGAGVSVALNRGNTPQVSKAQLVRTINAQANEIQMVKQENASIRAENADMKQMMFEMRQELNALKASK